MAVLDRRQFVQLNAALLAGAALPPAVRTGSARDTADGPSDSPGFYRFSLGEAAVVVLSDGAFRLPSDLPGLPPMSPAEFSALNVDPATREGYFRSRLVPEDDLPLPASPALIDSGGRRVLVDTGWAGLNGPETAGHLDGALDAAGIPHESIDIVLLTHGHPDHIGGLVHAGSREPRFPNAEVLITSVELDLWTDGDAVARFKDLPLPIVAMQDVFGALEGRLRTIRAGEEIAKGLRTIPSAGHTPGHVSLALEAGGREMLLVGDAVATIHSAFERPHWHNLFDMDPQQAAETRRRLLDRAAGDEMLILGYHFPFPGLGYAVRDDQAYRYYPAGWTVLT